MPFTVDTIDPDLPQVEIEFDDIDPDELAAWAATAPLWSGVPTPFGDLDPERMSDVGRLDAVVALERIKHWADAQQARILARMADHPDPVPAPVDSEFGRYHAAQEFLRDEVACALHVSFVVADERIRIAQALATRLSDTWALLNDGAISHLHCRRLVDATRDCDDATTADVEARVLPRAPQQTPAEFGRSVQRAVHRLDPRDRTTQQRAAAEHRHIRTRPLPHGMAELTVIHSAESIATLTAAVQAVADSYPAGDARSTDQKRADALVDIASAALTGSVIGKLPTRQGRKPAVQVTVALSTLLFLDEQCGELDSPGLTGPIPAAAARAIAHDLSATWRTLVTDHTGRLLDYGRTVYRPPAALREFIIARDRTCRIPGCDRPARRSDLDHRTRRTDGGATNPANVHPLCEHHHYAKDEAGWTCRLASDGTTVWTTPLGRTHTKPAETLPQDHTGTMIRNSVDPPPF